MFYFRARLRFPILSNILLNRDPARVRMHAPLITSSGDEKVLPNSNQNQAGRLVENKFTIRLEAAMGEWYPKENDGPGLKTAAFRQEGGPLSTPGPLICVTEATEIHVTV